jgi:hypothetical protein
MVNGKSLSLFAASCHPASSVSTIASYDGNSQLDIDSSVFETVKETLEKRPDSTSRKYGTYQREYIEWCNNKRFPDQDTVTCGKLHLYLQQEVVGRSSKINKEKRIGHQTVCGYVNAIVDLYNQQVSLRRNSNPHPRSNAVKLLLSNIKSETTKIKKQNYQDRGIGTLLDGYQSTEQFASICECFFKFNDTRGRACFLLSHFGLLRGENVRALELADMFSQILDGEGFSECIALVLLIKYFWKDAARRVHA